MQSFSILLRFVRLSFSDPRLTLRLFSPKRFFNALALLFKHPSELHQVFKNYQSIYGVTNNKNPIDLLETCRATKAPVDIFIFPVIDWHYRYQRPQHIACGLGRLGYRVFYVATSPLMASNDGRFIVTEHPAQGVFLCKLRSTSGIFGNLHQMKMSNSDCDSLSTSLKVLMQSVDSVQPPVIILNHPYWTPLLKNIKTCSTIYDCMDHHAGFSEGANDWLEGEIELLEVADHVVTTSTWLHDHVATIRDSVLIRNGCEFFRFSQATDILQTAKPTVGYVGAISGWFDMALVISAARKFTEWEFVLVGSTTGCDTSTAELEPNIQFIGEVSYDRVSFYIQGFDVCIIPFRATSLTQATNPVKVYEYLAAGKPVVSSSLPEVLLLNTLIYSAHSTHDFLLKLELAMAESEDRNIAAKRQQWAKDQDWSKRVAVFAQLFSKNI